jgi:hypothetical protein
MAYPQITEYQEAVQHPALAFVDPALRQGTVAENNLGLPLVMSGGFALTYAVTTAGRKYAVRCFHREIPAIQQKYNAISKKLRSLANGYFVDFDFQPSGINIRHQVFPVVRMDWVEGDTLGVWLDKHVDDAKALAKARVDFAAIARFLAQKRIAHGDIQNGNVMVANGDIKLIDYDGMFVPDMRPGHGSETGHRHFQHPQRRTSNFGPEMDRFSFIALDLSLAAVIEDKSLYKKFREGGETIIFKANDFADPQGSEIFQRLLAMAKLKGQACKFAAICEAPLAAVPTLDDFLAGRNIPAARTPIKVSPAPEPKRAIVAYMPAYPVVDALNFSAALNQVGDRVELIGRIVEVEPGSRKRGKGPAKHYVFLNFGSGRGNTVKISIWSEGLAKLKDRPSKAWVGRWVSVTGLMEVRYENKRYGHKHLSITVQEDGQIQQINEVEAGLRLASAASVSCSRDPALGTNRSNVTPAAPVAVAAQPTSSARRQRSKRASQQPQPQPSAAAQAPAARDLLSKVPRWIWVVGTLLVLLVALGLGANALRSVAARAISSAQTAVTARAAPSIPASGTAIEQRGSRR